MVEFAWLLACRLVDSLTWDDLLNTLRTLFFNFKLSHGAWCLGLGMAAAKGIRRVMADDSMPGDTCIGISATGRNSYAFDTCLASCRACPICLRAEQVNMPVCKQGSQSQTTQVTQWHVEEVPYV